MSSSLDAVQEDLQEVETLLQSAQDPESQAKLQYERRQLMAELRRLQEVSGDNEAGMDVDPDAHGSLRPETPSDVPVKPLSQILGSMRIISPPEMRS
ncbi:hypothetical protein WJX73_008306 [Symbiochloris irregularis]|uniref:Uncharacterized protein n=1 Tax=Symbiochloris irregularis TaxID=706552 RepID=A0AAW1PSE2_9CHLO